MLNISDKFFPEHEIDKMRKAYIQNLKAETTNPQIKTYKKLKDI